MSRIRLVTLVTLIILVLGLAWLGSVQPGSLQPVRADAAPPWYAQGASVEASESKTRVQMVSEQVLLVVEGRGGIAEERWLTADYAIGHVEATFVMRNQGAAAEAFGVWFPLGGSDGFDGPVENFAAWVNWVPVETGQAQTLDEWDRPFWWATWSVTFPTDRDVVLRVTYDVLPVGYRPYGRFHYTLRTGAGWWGSIGEATVTFRLPYEVNVSNTVLHNWWRGICLPSPDTFTVSGTDVIWHFTELEPTEGDDVCLTVLAPPMWQEITDAQWAVRNEPDSAEAHLRLARALAAVLWFKDGLEPVGNSTGFAELADASFRRALELAPEDVGIYVEYLELLQSFSSSHDPLPGSFLPVLERALALAPGDERLLQMEEWAAKAQTRALALTPTVTRTPARMRPPTGTPPPTRTPTVTPTSMPSSMSTATRTSTSTRTPTSTSTRTPVPMDIPTATYPFSGILPRWYASTPMPTDIAAAAQVPTPTPVPSIASPLATPAPNAGDAGGMCQGALAVALLPVGVLWVARVPRKS